MTVKKVPKIRRCARCGRRLRNRGAQWACAIDIDRDQLGTVSELFCPGCTTLQEHIEREINDATVDYIWVGDRVSMRPKGASNDDNTNLVRIGPGG